MSANKESIDRVLKMANERGEFILLEDGYVHYWPDGSKHGAMPSWALRVLADEMDKRNAVWDAVIQADVGGPCLVVWKFKDAPEELRALSTHGGDEGWLALVPPGLASDEEMWWMRWYPGGVQRTKCPKYPDFEVWIGALDG